MLYKQHSESLTGVWFLCIFSAAANHICSYSHWNESDRQCMVEIGRQSWCNTCPYIVGQKSEVTVAGWINNCHGVSIIYTG